MRRFNVWWRVGAAVGYVIMLVVNGLAGSTTVIGGVNTAQISDSYPNLFAPAGFTFAIWGVIYLLLGIYTAYSLISLRHDNAGSDALINKLTPLYLGTSVINCLWLLCWQHRLLGLSVLLMAGLLLLLIRIRLLVAQSTLNGRQSILIGWPFSVYFGWITVATVANVTTWLVSLGISGTGSTAAAWMMAITLVMATIAGATIWRFGDIAYGTVILWALYGIVSKHSSASGWDRQYPGVITVLYGSFAAMLLVLAIVWKRRRRPAMPR